jgi:hypothetical protein
MPRFTLGVEIILGEPQFAEPAQLGYPKIQRTKYSA